MVGIGIGIGIGIGRSQGTPQPAKPSSDALCQAIAETKIVRFKHHGKALVVEPYAVFRTEKDLVLSAVVLRSEDDALNAWAPQDFEVKAIKNFAALDQTFLPSTAFDPADLGDKRGGRLPSPVHRECG